MGASSNSPKSDEKEKEASDSSHEDKNGSSFELTTSIASDTILKVAFLVEYMLHLSWLFSWTSRSLSSFKVGNGRNVLEIDKEAGVFDEDDTGDFVGSPFPSIAPCDLESACEPENSSGCTSNNEEGM